MEIEERERADALTEQRKLALVSADKNLLPALYPEVLQESVPEVAADQIPDGAQVDYRLVAPEGFNEDEYERLMAQLEDPTVTVGGDDGGGEWM